jgi:hypothetical protein
VHEELDRDQLGDHAAGLVAGRPHAHQLAAPPGVEPRRQELAVARPAGGLDEAVHAPHQDQHAEQALGAEQDRQPGRRQHAQRDQPARPQRLADDAVDELADAVRGRLAVSIQPS